MDPQVRFGMIKKAVEIEREDFGVIPVHQQMLAWGVTKKASVAQRPDDFLDLASVRVQP
jgi:peptide/nickel transport system substrate-binding protein